MTRIEDIALATKGLNRDQLARVFTIVTNRDLPRRDTRQDIVQRLRATVLAKAHARLLHAADREIAGIGRSNADALAIAAELDQLARITKAIAQVRG